MSFAKQKASFTTRNISFTKQSYLFTLFVILVQHFLRKIRKKTIFYNSRLNLCCRNKAFRQHKRAHKEKKVVSQKQKLEIADAIE